MAQPEGAEIRIRGGTILPLDDETGPSPVQAVLFGVPVAGRSGFERNRPVTGALNPFEERIYDISAFRAPR